ncbi:MAG: DUF2505 family protein [Nevskiales bacterium]
MWALYAKLTPDSPGFGRRSRPTSGRNACTTSSAPRTRPLEHQGGSIRLESVAEGTRVNWTTTFRVKLPLIGGLATKLLAPQLERAFQGILNTIEHRPIG